MSKHKYPVFLLLAVAAVLPLLLKSEYYMHICVLAMMYIMLTQGLNLLTGYIGQLSLGHQTFLGLGGYCSALLALQLGLPVIPAMFVAGVFTAVCSYLIGLVTFRMRGSYFVIMTTAFAEIVRLVINNSTPLTGGPMGLRNIPSPSIFGYELGTKTAFYYFGLVLAAITVFVCWRITDSRTGRAFIALREQEQLANSVGISFAAYAMIAAVVGGFFAGIAGSFYAHYTHFISTDVITFNYTVTMLLMVIIGGKGTIMGPVLGAVVFSFVPELLRNVDNLRLPIYGLILMVSVLSMPNGLMPVLSQWYHRVFNALRRKAQSGREDGHGAAGE